ncbi:hypothetical protein NKL07_02330 [Mesorhizobium sp. C280B]|uniref:hypothetical protein n=1 Tax=unclassified Mesorhizobium TaxID=325217 RepID=UPI0003CEC854|nr:hypothetical protein [Mesorhizobium sp. LSJC280B00]ESW63972.1 hypothetical protein X772_36140 [Mesorhizobium sp. LSJC280B00]
MDRADRHIASALGRRLGVAKTTQCLRLYVAPSRYLARAGILVAGKPGDGLIRWRWAAVILEGQLATATWFCTLPQRQKRLVLRA